MSKREIYEKKTEEFVLPILEEFGFEFVDVEYVKEGQDYYLRVYIDKEGGITIDDCEAVSRRMNDILDRENYIDDQYIFEVSSPGLGRELKKERDYKRNLNKEIEIKTYASIEGKKQFEGILCAYNEDSVTIESNNKKLTIEKNKISLIRQALHF